MNILTLEDGYLMSEQQLTLASMDGVALQNMGKYTQLQIFSGHKVDCALYLQRLVDRQGADRGRVHLAGEPRRARARTASLARAVMGTFLVS